MASCLSHRFVFGVQGSKSNSIGFSDETTLLYVAGHNVVIHDILEGKQRFIHGSESSTSIAAMALSPSARFVALAEDGAKATVSLHDLRTLRAHKNLCLEEGGRCVSLAFSHDSNLLLTQGGAPNWNLVLWNWVKARSLARIRTSENSPIHQVSFSPVDTSLSCVCGDFIFRFYRMAEGDIRPMASARLKEHNFTCHTWLKQPEDHLILGTETGQLALFKSGDFVCYLAGAPGRETKVTALMSFSQGFMAGCSNGRIRMYIMDLGENTDPARMFECKQTWGIDSTTAADVVNLALCPNEDRLCAVTSNNQLLGVKIASHNTKENNMEPVISLFHGRGVDGCGGGITGMDTCVRKPLVATCGVDRTVRVWNIVEQRLDTWKMFQEEPCSLAMHPSGLHIVVGFVDKLRVMNLSMDDMRTCRDIPIKQCREVKFSNGGSMIAAANGNVVTVFDFITFNKLVDLRGHNSKVRHLFWGAHDQTLISSGQDGAVYRWDVDEAKRVGEFVQKGIMYTCTLSTKESVFTVGNDNFLKELEISDLQVVKELNAGAILGQIAMSNSEHVLFAGTSDVGKPGCIRAYNFPLTGDYFEYPCMGAPITRLCVSRDDQFVLAADAASCLFVFHVRDRQDRMQSKGKPSGSDLQPLASSETRWVLQRPLWTNSALEDEKTPLTYLNRAMAWITQEILVTRSNLEDRSTFMVELKNKVDELALHNEYQLRLRDMNYSEKIKEITEKYTHDLEQNKNKFELLRFDAVHAQLREGRTIIFEQTLSAKVPFTHRISVGVECPGEERAEIIGCCLLDSKKWFKTRVLDGSAFHFVPSGKREVLHTLSREEKSDLEMDYKARLREMDEKHQHELQELEAIYQQKIMGEVERYQALVQERNMQQERWDEQQKILESTHQRHVSELREEFEQRLGEDRDLRLQCHEEKMELHKKFAETRRQVEDDIDTEIDNLRKRSESQLAAEREATLRYKGENGIMNKKFAVLTKDIEDQKEEIRTLYEKEKDLQQKIKGLEREIAAHKREIKFRDDTIGGKEKKIYELKKKNQELEKFKFVLDFKIKELKRQIEPRETEIGTMKEHIRGMDKELEQFHKTNAQLDLSIGELREKLDGMHAQNLSQRKRIADQEASRVRLQIKLHECVQHIQDPAALRQHVTDLHRADSRGDSSRSEIDASVIHEYHRHEEYLESSLYHLRDKFVRDMGGHRTKNVKVMQENMLLMKEINIQRGHNKAAKQALEAQVNMLKRLGLPMKQRSKIGTSQASKLVIGKAPETGPDEDPSVIIERNKARIAELRALIADLEGKAVFDRSYSRETLPPMDGGVY